MRIPLLRKFQGWGHGSQEKLIAEWVLFLTIPFFPYLLSILLSSKDHLSQDTSDVLLSYNITLNNVMATDNNDLLFLLILCVRTAGGDGWTVFVPFGINSASNKDGG